MEHPRTRRRPSAISRREFLRRSAEAGIALPSAAAILAACAKSEPVSETPQGLKLARPNDPVTLPLPAGNPPIADGLPPESGPLRLYAYDDYIWRKVRNAFSERFGADVEYTVFETPEEMVAKLKATGASFDLLVTITLDNVGKLAAGELIQPLNQSYLPNVADQLWPELPDFYDVGRRYTVPYVIFTTGIAWRNDMVSDNIGAMDDPWDVFWDTRFAGQAHLLNGYRDTLAVGLLRDGYDPNESDPAILDKVKQEMLDGVAAMNWKFDHVDYQELSLNQWQIHNAWSGSMGYYQWNLPEGVDITSISYVWPPQTPSKAKGMLSHDLFAIPKGAAHPVLAHEMINFLYDPEIALQNYTYESYQPPIRSLDETTAVKEGYLPANFAHTIVTPDMIPLGVTELELTPAVDQLYQRIYQEITGGV
jgi:spermidine/putrescine transport system substrate-binding protein